MAQQHLNNQTLIIHVNHNPEWECLIITFANAKTLPKFLQCGHVVQWIEHWHFELNLKPEILVYYTFFFHLVENYLLC